MPAFAFAATTTASTKATAPAFKPLEVSGWIPYWRAATGTTDVMPHLDELTEINPFGYSVKSDGTLYDAMSIGQDPWTSLIAAARAKHVRVVPTIMWSDTDAIYATLSNSKKRRAFEDQIAEVVKQNGFDGIDIDFENKSAETRPYFSLFLEGLYQRLSKTQFLDCTIEARTPPDSAFSKTPATLEYANDYNAINRYCDRVRIMAYDQGHIDLKLDKLNNAATSTYSPVADPAWVEKVVKYAEASIAKSKIVIGIPTYGYEYDVRATPQGFVYDLLWAFNPRYGTDLATQYNVTPSRGSSGEMQFSYVPVTTNNSTPQLATLAPNGTSSGDLVSQGALAAATSSSQPLFNFVVWSDASSIADKIALAKRLGVRGVAIFKMDGGEDPNLWTVLMLAKTK